MLKRAYNGLRRRSYRMAINAYSVLSNFRYFWFSDEAHVRVDRGGRLIICRLDEFDEFAFEHGDVLTLRSNTPAVMTPPDGSFHILAGPARPICIPPQMQFCQFQNYRLPVHLLNLTGGGVDMLGAIGEKHVSNYEKFMGLAKGCTVLEIGCGIGRDAFQLVSRQPPIGRYIGIDVTRDSILWCQKNITTRYPNFVFHHFDARHELYNPLGSRTSMDFQLPAEDGSIDRIFLGSVFTHLFEEEITHYMREIRRVLRPGGLAYATFFLYSEEIIEAARRTKRSPNGLIFEHAYADGCYISDASYPTGSVAFTDEAIQRMMAKANLKLARPYLPGWWSGCFEEAEDGQEVAILTPDLSLPSINSTAPAASAV
jgi:SAM-dependent methyltransferase